ncbi:MAG: ABC transporter permease [Pseudomonadota bacterium]
MPDVNLRQPGGALGGNKPSSFIKWTAWAGLFFLVLPSIIILPMSFGDKNELYFPPRSFSLFLYKQYFFESVWMETTYQSFRVAIASTFLALFFGSTVSYGLVRASFPGKKLLGALLLSPLFVPPIVIALGLYLYFAPLGLQGTTIGLILAHTLYITPFVIVIAMGALQSIDENLESAARVMGAGRIYTFWRVTLPQLRPALVSGGLVAFLMSFDELIISFFLSGFGTQTLPVKMFDNIKHEISPVLAAISVLLTLLALIIALIATWYQDIQSQRKAQMEHTQ